MDNLKVSSMWTISAVPRQHLPSPPPPPSPHPCPPNPSLPGKVASTENAEQIKELEDTIVEMKEQLEKIAPLIAEGKAKIEEFTAHLRR